MAQLKFGSAGVTAREIDLSSPVKQEPVGIPAGVIGTSQKGPAFVPVTVGGLSDFFAKFGNTDGKKFGPLAVNEWLKNAGALTYLRVLGVGDGNRRLTASGLVGSVSTAGFVVGEKQPDKDADGLLSANPYANLGGGLGRTYMLGCFMSESLGSSFFSDAKIQGPGASNGLVNSAVPILRGILMAPSGVIVRMSSSFQGTNTAPASTLVATEANSSGVNNGSVILLENSAAKQDFVLLLNGHKGTDSNYPNYLTASFDMTSPNYFANVLNKDPLQFQKTGHYLYAHWDIHPSQAAVTGSGLIVATSGSSATLNQKQGTEAAAFLLTGSQARNVGTSTVPNFENWEDRFAHAKSPWFISQKFGGNRSNLFRFHALDSGACISSLYKISIENIAPSTDPRNLYGSFDVVVRDFGDRDTATKPLEAFRGVNLDPKSDRYIAKVIGDAHIYFDFDRSSASQKVVVDGQYALQSNLIRVEVDSSVENEYSDPTALPIGVRGHSHLITSGTAPLAPISSNQVTTVTSLRHTVQPPVSFRKNLVVGEGAKATVNPQLYWGVQFEHKNSVTTLNASTLADKSVKSFAKYFPDFTTVVQPVIVGDNEGVTDTAANGILDADRFNLGMFALDNIKVVTGTNGLADNQEWDQAVYIRDGNIGTDETAKTRRLSLLDFNQTNRTYLKFSTFLQGGFDGTNIFDTDEAQLTNAAVVEDMADINRGLSYGPNVQAYKTALNIMKSKTDVDIQLLAIPGLRHSIISDTAVLATEERGDCMYIMDIEQLDTEGNNITLDSQLPDVSKTVNLFANRSMDTSYASAYFPDTVVEDPTTKTNVVVPPSVVVLGALALNDAVGHPWFAPAGFTRGALPSTLEARVALSKENADALYDVDINPLMAFPGNAISGINPKGGVVVWGQKTLLQAASSLDRVNVRRLLITIRREISDIAQTIVFEPNRSATLARFSAAVTPRLQRVQSLSGLERFKVTIDASTTTEQDVLNNTIRGKIFVQPTKVAEFVSLDFVVSNNVSE